MTKEFKEPLISYWYRALNSPCGIELDVSDVIFARTKLYKVRSDAKDLDLEIISVCESPFDPMKLWMVKRTPPNAKT